MKGDTRRETRRDTKGGTKKNPHAVALGRLGGKVKVPKGIAMLSPAERRALARKAAAARWANREGAT